MSDPIHLAADRTLPFEARARALHASWVAAGQRAGKSDPRFCDWADLTDVQRADFYAPLAGAPAA